MVDPNADKEPGEEMHKAVKSFSFMACNYFVITLSSIAALLGVLLIVREPKTMASSGIVIKFIIGIVIFVGAYVIYRILDKKKTNKI